MKLTMLGTGNALVTECYNTCFVMEENGEYFLVDGGGGNEILRRLKMAGIDWKNIKTIFVTHKHIDHFMGIIWLIRMICQNMNKGTYDGDVTLYGHDEVISLIRDISEKLIGTKFTKYFDSRVHLTVVSDGDQKQILNRPVTFFDICSTKAKQFGFQMRLTQESKFTCCGDEPCAESAYALAYDSEWLMHEAFCLFGEADIFGPYEKHHSTVKDACLLAEKLNVKNLILYHTEDKNILNRKTLYTKEGKEYYSGNLYVPNDMEEITVL